MAYMHYKYKDLDLKIYLLQLRQLLVTYVKVNRVLLNTLTPCCITTYYVLFKIPITPKAINL